jgi:DnaJ family protein C protein 2
LLDPAKRRQFDSVDEGADVEPPSKKQTQKGNFYKLWGPVFESEGRFSKKNPVPRLGNDKSTKEEVETFYDFWYNFDSWRSFEYQDEDVPDDNESRDQKRHIERKNQNARRKKKTEDTARLRKLVDTALELDERIKKFRKEEHAQKNKKRLEKEAEAKRLAEEAAKKKEEDARLAAEKEAAEKAEKLEGKKAKEAAKNAAKKNKRVVRAAAKDANYFADGAASASQIDAVLNDVDVVIAKVDNEELATLTAKLNGKKNGGEIKAIFVEEVKRLKGAGKVKDGELKTME